MSCGHPCTGFHPLPRAFAQALANERWPLLGKRLGERVLDPAPYARRDPFDWTTGAVLAVRREAFEAVGGFDEDFFLFSEETDLCKRVQDVGWQARLEPRVTFIHHAGKAGIDPAREAQMAYARLQYARKHFSRLRAAAYGRFSWYITRFASSPCAFEAPPDRRALPLHPRRSGCCSVGRPLRLDAAKPTPVPAVTPDREPAGIALVPGSPLHTAARSQDGPIA